MQSNPSQSNEPDPNPDAPIWERLSVSEDGSIVSLNGLDYPLNSPDVADFLRKLLKAKGQTIKGDSLRYRPDRVFKNLPKPIKGIS